MRVAREILLGFFLFASSPVSSNSEDASCMVTSYTDEQNVRLAVLLSELDMLGAERTPVSEEINSHIEVAVDLCAKEHSWRFEQASAAGSYEFARLYEAAWRSHGPLSADELAAVDLALTKGDRTKLWFAIKAQTNEGMTGETSATKKQDLAQLELFMQELGHAQNADKSYQVGMLLGFMAMQILALEAFAAGQ